MVKFVQGYSIFEHDADLYVITVNLVAVMGAGVAKAFRERYPKLFQQYRKDCRNHVLALGYPQIYDAEDGKRFMMFPTKDNWKGNSQLPWVIAGLEWMIDNAGSEFAEDARIVMPPLGCGNGKLPWWPVSKVMHQTMECVPNPVTVVVPPWLWADTYDPNAPDLTSI